MKDGRSLLELMARMPNARGSLFSTQGTTALGAATTRTLRVIVPLMTDLQTIGSPSLSKRVAKRVSEQVFGDCTGVVRRLWV